MCSGLNFYETLDFIKSTMLTKNTGSINNTNTYSARPHSEINNTPKKDKNNTRQHYINACGVKTQTNVRNGKSRGMDVCVILERENV